MPSKKINKKLNLIEINNIDMNNLLEYLNDLEISPSKIKLIYKSVIRVDEHKQFLQNMIRIDKEWIKNIFVEKTYKETVITILKWI